MGVHSFIIGWDLSPPGKEEKRKVHDKKRGQKKTSVRLNEIQCSTTMKSARTP
jgi:hypothetical protein